jgi:hypothetical protein
MKLKILIGSILAVAILISVSFVSVVGYQSVKTNDKYFSPLFSIRTQRAAQEVNEKGFTTNYLGKGEKLSILFPEKGFFTNDILDQIILKISQG